MERKGRLLLLFILLGFVKSENSLSFFFRQWEQDARRPSPAQGRCEGDPRSPGFHFRWCHCKGYHLDVGY